MSSQTNIGNIFVRRVLTEKIPFLVYIKIYPRIYGTTVEEALLEEEEYILGKIIYVENYSNSKEYYVLVDDKCDCQLIVKSFCIKENVTD